MLRRLSEFAISLFFPSVCETCGSAVPSSPTSGVCARCASEIKLTQAPFCVSCGRTLLTDGQKCGECADETFHHDRAFACALYEGKMKELLQAYKFKRRKHLKNTFAKIMMEFAESHLTEKNYDCVLAVPLDQKKHGERGFNQSELLSKTLARNLKLEHTSGSLVREKSNRMQSLLTKPERKKNVAGCFKTKGTDYFQKKNVLLVDDIFTTGQTASECAKVLKKAGAHSVTVLALARGI